MKFKLQCPLEQATPTHSHSVPGCLLDTMEEPNYCSTDHTTCKAKNIYCLFTEKKMRTSVLEVLGTKGTYLAPTLPISTALLQVWESRRFHAIPSANSTQSLICRMG